MNNVEQLVAELAAGKSVGSFRPLHFHGVFAMKLSDDIKPGWKNNPMSELKGEGGYFDDYVVWPDTK